MAKSRNSSPKPAKTAPGVIIVKFELRGTRSKRVIALPTDIDVIDLLGVALDAFGFDNSHLSRFHSKRLGAATAINPYREDCPCGFRDDANPDLWTVTLDKVFPEVGECATIEYDFGDGWEIAMRRMADKKIPPPSFTCLKSEGIDAIDDCGGPWGLNDIEEVARLWLAKGDAAVKDDPGYENFKFTICGDEDIEQNRDVIERAMSVPSCGVVGKRVSR